MSESFAAQPGTMLIQATQGKSGFTFIPIVGWEKTKGGRVSPLVPQMPIAIQHGVAIAIRSQIAPEIVSDPTYKCTFDSVSKWLAFIAEKEDSGECIHESQDAEELMASISFGDKTYIKKSYWIFRNGETEFLFEIEGGLPYPDDPRVTKSNRLNFQAMKKDMPVVDPYGVSEDETETDEEMEDLI